MELLSINKLPSDICHRLLPTVASLAWTMLGSLPKTTRYPENTDDVNNLKRYWSQNLQHNSISFQLSVGRETSLNQIFHVLGSAEFGTKWESMIRHVEFLQIIETGGMTALVPLVNQFPNLISHNFHMFPWSQMNDFVFRTTVRGSIWRVQDNGIPNGFKQFGQLAETIIRDPALPSKMMMVGWNEFGKRQFETNCVAKKLNHLNNWNRYIVSNTRIIRTYYCQYVMLSINIYLDSEHPSSVDFSRCLFPLWNGKPSSSIFIRSQSDQARVFNQLRNQVREEAEPVVLRNKCSRWKELRESRGKVLESNLLLESGLSFENT